MNRPMKRPAAWLGMLTLLTVVGIADVQAFTVGITAAPRSLYLRVGDGAFTNTDFNSGGTPQSGGTLNRVAVTVPGNQLLTGVDQAMSSTSRLTSDYDGFAFCNAGQTYIGGYSRNNNGGGDATLTAVVTTPLSNGTEVIAFSQIRWVASGNDPAGTVQPIASNNFGNVSKQIATFQRNTWSESCHNFFYSNDNVVSAGTYDGRITYTLTAP